MYLRRPRPLTCWLISSLPWRQAAVMAVIAAIQWQKLQPARKACGCQHSSLRVIIRKTFLAVVDVTCNKEILEGQDMVKHFRGNLFKDAKSTVSYLRANEMYNRHMGEWSSSSRLNWNILAENERKNMIRYPGNTRIQQATAVVVGRKEGWHSCNFFYYKSQHSLSHGWF